MKSSQLLRASRSDRSKLYALARPYRRHVILLAIASFATGSAEGLFLVLVTRIALGIADDVDQYVLVGDVTTSLATALLIACLLICLRFACAYGGSWVSASLNENASSDLRGELSSAFLSSSWATQQNEPSGRLLQLVTSFVNQAVGTISSLTSMIGQSLNLLALLATSVSVSPVASLVVIVSLITFGSLLAPFRRRVKARARLNSRAQLEYSTAVSELGEMGLEMKTFGVTTEFSNRIRHLSNQVARTGRRLGFFRSLMPHFYTTLTSVALVAALLFASSVGIGELSAVGAVMLVMLRSLNYGQSLQTSSASLAAAMPFLDELEEARNRYHRARATSGLVDLDRVERIECDDVSFSYTVDRPALQHVSCTISPGEVIGIIGPSGSGKSTLVQLLLGLREPSSGSIRVGGVLLSDVDRDTWTNLTSFVPQDPHLFTGTVAENIRFFRNDLDDRAVRDAARRANILADIEALPEGFDTHIGQRGVQLSGGQRQRISIARALVGAPKLLVLDEPTSALDVHSEAMIRETVAQLRGDVTVVIIAHRLSTLDVCDRLMVIEGGTLVAFDAPEQLRANSEFYREALLLSGID